MKKIPGSSSFLNGLVNAIIFVILSSTNVHAQTNLNFGLSQPQDKGTLPKSVVQKIMTVRKPKINIPASLQKKSDNEFVITSGWDMAEAEKVIGSKQSIFSPDFDTSDWYNATVPGTVLTTLVDQGVFPDPYYGLNNLNIPDSLCRKDWWYRLPLKLPENIDKKNIWLIFNGINYKADIWLNGKLLGRMAGAFKRGQFDATPILNKQGKNILAVHIYPPNNPGIPHEESSKTGPGPNGGQLCLDGPTFISSEGWDWIPGIRDRNIGIWQDVLLRLTGPLTISDPQVITDLPLPDTTKVEITIKSLLCNHSSSVQKVFVKGSIGDIFFTKNFELNAGESKTVVFSPAEFLQLNLKNPKLWWPNGYGRQELYTLQLQAFSDKGNFLDQTSCRFGVREFSYELAVAQPGKSWWRIEFNPLKSAGKVMFDNINRLDAGKGTYLPGLAAQADTSLLTTIDKKSDNPFLVIKINGIPVFCRGGNWGMDDGMKRVSREKLEPYFRLHRDANFNMIRNWTGESTEKIFYDLCDEYGMLVWNDFWLSTEGYNLNVNDDILFMDNATDVVKRFRNHPSIAVWCPRNEGYAPGKLEPFLQSLIANEDGTRHYAPNSRNLNLRPSGPWNYQADPSEYYSKIAEGFSTELGSPSIPTAATIRSFIPKQDQWPISDTWYYHDLHNGQKEYIHAIENKYGPSHDLDDFSRKAQFVNYNSYRAMFESWNSKMWKQTSGILLWMSHPAWPSMVWQTYSWDYETFGSYYGSKKACEPLHIQINPNDNKISVINTSLKNYNKLTSKIEIYSLDGKRVYEMDEKIDVPANQLASWRIADNLPMIPPVYLLRLSVMDGKNILSQNEYWRCTAKTENFNEFNTLSPVQISTKLLRIEKGKMVFVVSNTSKTPAINLKFNIIDKESNKIVLPAYFSDGYFTLIPGEKKQIVADWDRSIAGKKVIVAEGYNFKSQTLLSID